MANKKIDSSLKNMALSLIIICGTMSFALGIVYSLTKKPIEIAEKKKVNDAIKAVIPDFDNDPIAEIYNVDGLDFYPAKKNNKLIGVAVKSYSNNGYAGFISIMVGISSTGSIINTAIMSQKETPGLGTKMKEPKFKDQFKGKNPDSYILKVKKDGGNVDAITAATISSRAFCDGIDRAFGAYKKSRNSSIQNDTLFQSKGELK